MKKIKIFFIVLAVLSLGFIATIAARNSTSIKDTSVDPVQHVAGKYDALATCIKDKGVIFYGAFWCSHCKANKDMFGTSVDLLPYVECSTTDGKGQTQVCIDQKITSYPTWRFADGSEHVGEITFEILAQKTACPLPE